MDSWYIDSWRHLMGSLDDALTDARNNAASLRDAREGIEQLLTRAEAQRAAAETALHELAQHRNRLAATLDDMQRELAVAGVPLRGDIS
jgi:chromosome segregation ATPase